MSLDVSNFTVNIAPTYTGTALQGASPIYSPVFAWSAPLTTGVGANQADKLYTATITLGPSAGQDVDLAGVLNDPFGVALSLVKLKAVAVRAALTNVNNVNISRPATNGVPWFLAAADAVALGPGGLFLFVNPGAAGIASVTAATADILRFDNSGAGTSVSFDLVVIGTSA